MIRLENWCIVLPMDPYKAPEILANMGAFLQGHAYGHPRHEDGKLVTTSKIVGYKEEEDTFLTQSGSEYMLGKVDDAYDKAFPGAKERMIATLQSREVES